MTTHMLTEQNHRLAKKVLELQGQLNEAKAEAEQLRAIKTPSPAADCVAEQAAGNGPCGACAGCCHALRVAVERLRPHVCDSEFCSVAPVPHAKTGSCPKHEEVVK